MQKIFFALLFLFYVQKSFSQNQCWENEINTQTKKTFNEKEWTLTKNEWQSLEPETVSYFQLFKAWKIYKSETISLSKIKNDKKKHCYLGCRISQEVNLKTSIYLAWYKEIKDLTDCNKKTLFESIDADATLDGAEFGAQTNVPESCQSYCL